MKILLLLTGLAILAGLHVCSGLEISKSANIEKPEENNVLSIQEKTRVDRAAQKKNEKKGSNKATRREENKGGKRKQKRKSKKQKSKTDKARKSGKYTYKGRKTSRKLRKNSKKGKIKAKKPSKRRKSRKTKKLRKAKKSTKRRKSRKEKKLRKANLKPKKKDTVDMVKSIKNEKTINLEQRAVYKGTNCEYIDLCALDTKAQNGCKDGEKFVVKGARGSVKTRRQFLILDGKKIIAFLQSGKKITDCKGNMTDVTSKVSCKAIPGAGEMKIDKQVAPAPAPAPPTECPGKCNIPSTTLTSNPVVKCPCPEGKTCFTTIKSNAFSHTVTCGKVTETRQCGGPLYGTKKGILIDIEKYAHPLCSGEKQYLTLIKDLEWKCKDLDIKPCNICPGTTPPAYPPVPCPTPPTPPPTPTPPTPTPPTPTPPTPTPPTPTPPTPTPPTPTPPTPTPPTPTPPTPTPPTPTPPTPTPPTPAPPTPTPISTIAPPRRRRGLRLPVFVFN